MQDSNYDIKVKTTQKDILLRQVKELLRQIPSDLRQNRIAIGLILIILIVLSLLRDDYRKTQDDLRYSYRLRLEFNKKTGKHLHGSMIQHGMGVAQQDCRLRAQHTLGPRSEGMCAMSLSS